MNLRDQVLKLDPTTVGLTPARDHITWGCLMETGYPNGSSTLVCLADGTTSLYTSSGGGVIGGGAQEAVVARTQKLLAAVHDHLVEMIGEADRALPPTDEQSSVP